jgi:glycosyltransferase involved in cell wall biosynthesis
LENDNIKPKIALITNSPSPYRIPLFEKLSKLVDLTVYFTNLREKDRNWDVKYDYKFNYKVLKDYTLRYDRGKKDGLNYPINPSIIREITKNDYDAVIFGGYSSFTTILAFLTCKIKKIPFLLWLGGTNYHDSLLNRLAKPFITGLMRNTDAFLTYGSRAKEYVISFGVPSEKIFLAVNVGDVDYFRKKIDKYTYKKKELKKELGIHHKRNIIFVGSLSYRKGVEYLLPAFYELKKEYENLGLLLLGDGPLKEKLIEKYGDSDQVHFIGFVQQDELSKYYAISDIFILPTIGDIFSIVVSEAMASNLPIIATKNDGSSVDIVKNGFNGYVINSKDSNEIYGAIEKMLENPDLKKMAENSREMIDNQFNLDKYAESFLNAINHVLNAN